MAEPDPQPTPTPEPPARPVPCVFANSVCAERVAIGPGVRIPVFSTHSLAEGDGAVTRGLIVVHGNSRNPDAYFETGIAAVVEGASTATTAVVAPHFQTIEDGPERDEPYWSSGGWKRGSLSQSAGPSPRVSSYAALDSIALALMDARRFPALREVVVAGHSAGGQVLHRYAATSPVEEQARDGVSLRYVVSAPSSYLYLRPERDDGGGGFAVPGADCADYDEWHYGLEERNAYARASGADSIRAMLARRGVRIVVGDGDTLSASLDQSCGANLQGPNRYRRAQILMRFMDEFFEGHGHAATIVPGLGHSSRSLWTSAGGVAVLFGS